MAVTKKAPTKRQMESRARREVAKAAVAPLDLMVLMSRDQMEDMFNFLLNGQMVRIERKPKNPKDTDAFRCVLRLQIHPNEALRHHAEILVGPEYVEPPEELDKKSQTEL